MGEQNPPATPTASNSDRRSEGKETLDEQSLLPPDDLIERLNELLHGVVETTYGFVLPAYGPGSYQFIEETADQASLALQTAGERVREAQQHRDALEGLFEEASARAVESAREADVLEARALAAEAEIKTLREALEPFAKAAPLLDDPAEDWEDDQLFLCERSHIEGEVAKLTAADFRRASLAFSAGGEA